MSKLKRLSRKLKLNSVNSAILVHDKRKELAMNMIKERATYDKEFCDDLIKAVGDNLPADIKNIAEQTINKCCSNEGCTCAVDVTKTELQDVLVDLSNIQPERLKSANITIPTTET